MNAAITKLSRELPSSLNEMDRSATTTLSNVMEDSSRTLQEFTRRGFT